MKVTVNRAELLAAAKRAANVASPLAPLDVLRGTLVEADSTAGKLTLSATNLETSMEQKVSCACQDNDAFVINAKLLEDMLAQLGEETVEFQREAGNPRVSVRSGQAGFSIAVMERGAFPKIEIPFPDDVVTVTGVPAMVKRSVFATVSGQSADQPLLKCVNLRFTKDGLRAVGSDGACMVSAKGDEKSTGNTDLLVPSASLLKLARMCEDKTEFRVGTNGKQIVFSREDFAYSARLMDGGYINVDQVLDALVNSFTVLTDVTDLKMALNAVIAINVAESIKLSFEGNQIRFHCQSGEGEASTALEVIPLTGTLQGEYWFSPRRLSACLHSFTGTVTLGIAQNGMLTLSTNDAFYMQTAMRPPAVKVEKPQKTAAKAKTPRTKAKAKANQQKAA